MSRRLMFIFAHPDDESFAVGGIARMHADSGAEVSLVTATRGDAGRAGEPPICSREDLPALREEELRRAAAILGIGRVDVLDYRDKHLAEAPHETVRQELVEAIRRSRPQVVVTFDPNGVNGHTDHVAISRYTIDAISAAGDARWHPGAGRAHQVQRILWTSPVLPWDAPKCPDLSREPGVDFVIDARPVIDAKAAALRAHRTQHVSIDRHFFNLSEVSEILSIETFRQAFGPRLHSRPGHDIFDGIVEEP